MEISYTCSLGNECHTAQILKRNKLKLCSYPFDWIFSSCHNIIHCIEDDFAIFLNKSYYIQILDKDSDKKCGHSYYNKQLFNHHNPLKYENDYNYFIRCVDRFKNLLRSPELKLFCFLNRNLDNITSHNYNDLIDFNNKFSKYTSNYILLVILNVKNKQQNYYNFKYVDNIHFLELHTISESNGLDFINISDNVFLDNIIKSTYKFNFLPISPSVVHNDTMHLSFKKHRKNKKKLLSYLDISNKQSLSNFQVDNSLKIDFFQYKKIQKLNFILPT